MGWHGFVFFSWSGCFASYSDLTIGGCVKHRRETVVLSGLIAVRMSKG